MFLFSKQYFLMIYCGIIIRLSRLNSSEFKNKISKTLSLVRVQNKCDGHLHIIVTYRDCSLLMTEGILQAHNFQGASLAYYVQKMELVPSISVVCFP